MLHLSTSIAMLNIMLIPSKYKGYVFKIVHDKTHNKTVIMKKIKTFKNQIIAWILNVEDEIGISLSLKKHGPSFMQFTHQEFLTPSLEA